MKKIEEIALLLLIYILIGMLLLLKKVVTTPWGFLLLTPRNAMEQIFLYPVNIIKNLIGV